MTLRCKGIGRGKLSILPAMLAEIARWREENTTPF